MELIYEKMKGFSLEIKKYKIYPHIIFFCPSIQDKS